MQVIRLCVYIHTAAIHGIFLRSKHRFPRYYLIFGWWVALFLVGYVRIVFMDTYIIHIMII